MPEPPVVPATTREERIDPERPLNSAPWLTAPPNIDRSPALITLDPPHVSQLPVRAIEQGVSVEAKTLALEFPGTLERERRLSHVADAQREKVLKRVLETLPAIITLIVISFLFWGPLVAPLVFVGMVLAFHAYWMYRAQMNGLHAVKGYLLLRRHKKTDWRELYERDKAAGKPSLEWADTRHIVMITNYTESADKLRLCLDSIANAEYAEQVVVVLAMEEREGEAGRQKADVLINEYRERIGDMFATFHPWGVPGEVAGKSSNENWSARVAKRRVVDEAGHDIDSVTITSCDVDTVFSLNYFTCLTYKFATDPDRYRRFWQSPIFFYNNIWDVPASLRMAHCLSGLNHIGRLSRSFFRMVFPQSTYSLSLRMAHEADYWDPDIIPEDWHMFLKCYYRFGGKVEVESMYTTLHMDGVRSKSYFGTFLNYYQQSKRHAWGCTDIPYAIQQSLKHPEIPLHKRLQRVWAVSESHLLWSTQWFLITTSKWIPLLMATYFGADIPHWFKGVTGWIMAPCFATLLLMLTLDAIMRPKRPKVFRWWHFPFQYGQYFVMAAITFFTSALPALDAQFRLALGKRLEYKVTEKA